VTIALWIKFLLHRIFLITGFAGLFSLPRLFAYRTEWTDDSGRSCLLVMERKPIAIMAIGTALTTLFGVPMRVTYLRRACHRSGWLKFRSAR
jgi:uncharacterized membrane protein